MKRRTLLAGVSLGPGLFAGCLGRTPKADGNQTNTTNGTSPSTENNTTQMDDAQSSEIEYEQCEAPYVNPNKTELPAPAQKEITTALQGGEYETTNDLILPQVFDIQESYIKMDRTDGRTVYYTANVEKDGEINRLSLTEEFPPVGSLYFRNITPEIRTFDIRLVYHADITTDSAYKGQGDVLFDETVELAALDKVEGHKVALLDYGEYRFGTYRLEISVDGENDDVVWSMSEEHDALDNAIEYTGSGELSPPKRRLSEYGTLRNCSWDEDGNLVSGLGSH
ncbi:hypothetical protein [Natronosalvus rutilus]|uniref:Lipoprotein n=1 Tax=Natronosalvus rutilus TaxID=2953753 RepID=A0A9E7NDA0_9EURY|nr:hypothetical protein [Natronosalvus rutilus]UTF54768.1 hypothetical protein NGM29_05735 [Natronosalvus rutilus]